ncbi:endothelin-converting enzyme-like 1 [Haemaphysalis longicornis]
MYLLQKVTRLAVPWCDHPTQCFDYEQELRSSVDRSVDPCDNLFEHVCGRWELSHPSMSNGQLSLLQARMSAFLYRRLEQRPPAQFSDSVAVRKVVQSYQSCHDVYQERRDDIQVLLEVFRKFKFEWPSLTLSQDFDLIDFLFGFPLDYGLPTPFLLTATPYISAGNRYALGLDVIIAHWRDETKADGFELHVVASCISLASRNSDNIAAEAAERIHAVYVQLESLLNTYLTLNRPPRHYVTLRELASATAPFVEVQTWLHVINAHLPADRHIEGDEKILTQSGSGRFIRELLISARPQAYVNLVLFAGWNMVVMAHEAMSYPLVQCLHKGAALIMSAAVCLGLTNDLASYAIGQFLNEELRMADAISLTRDIWRSVRDATLRNLGGQSWMDQATAKATAARLSDLTSIIVAPEHLNNSDALDAFYDYLPDFGRQPYMRSLLDALWRRSSKLKHLLAADVNVTVYREDVPTSNMANVNAYYKPFEHIIIIPDAILAPPFLSLSVPSPLNVGGIGKVLGHELTHALDPLLSGHTDGGDWYTARSLAGFLALLECVRAQLVNATGDHVHSNNALNEAFTDTAGTEKAYMAYRTLPIESPDFLGYTREQLFFVASCFVFCSPGGYTATLPGYRYPVFAQRCNLPASNNVHFAKAFNCSRGAPMSPQMRCSFHETTSL